MEAKQLVDEVVYACRTLNKKVVGGGQAMFSTGMLRLSFGDKILGWWYGLCYKRVLEYRELGACDEIDITEWINYRNNYWKDVNAYYK